MERVVAYQNSVRQRRRAENIDVVRVEQAENRIGRDIQRQIAERDAIGAGWIAERECSAAGVDGAAQVDRAVDRAKPGDRPAGVKRN